MSKTITSFFSLCATFISNKKFWLYVLLSIFCCGVFEERAMLNFLRVMPSLVGIFLAGALTVMAIAFGIVDSKTLQSLILKEDSLGKSGLYIKYLKSVKKDVYCEVVILIFVLFLNLWIDSDIPGVNYPLECLSKEKFVPALAFLSLALALDALIDVTNSLFTLLIIRYNNERNSQGKTKAKKR